MINKKHLGDLLSYGPGITQFICSHVQMLNVGTWRVGLKTYSKRKLWLEAVELWRERK